VQPSELVSTDSVPESQRQSVTVQSVKARKLSSRAPEIFSAEERERFEHHVRPMIEQRSGMAQEPHVTIWAWKNTPSPLDFD